MYSYGGGLGFGSGGCGNPCYAGYPGFGSCGCGGFGSNTAIILVLFILLVIVIGSRINR